MAMSSRKRLLSAFSMQEPDRVPISPLFHVQFPSKFLGIPLNDLASPLATYPVWKAELETFKKFGMDALVEGDHYESNVQAKWPLPFLHQGAAYMELPKNVRIRVEATKEETGRVWFKRDFETPEGVLETTCVLPREDQAWEKKPLISDPENDLEKLKCVLDGKITLAEYDKVREAVGESGAVKVTTQFPLNFYVGYRDTTGKMGIIDLYTRPDLVKEYLKAFMDLWLVPLAEVCSEHQIDVMWLDCTYMGFLSARMFTDYALSDLKEIRKKASFPLIIFFSGGPCFRFLELLREVGVDCVEGLEPPPVGDIILSKAKETIGDRVCLKGNVEITLLESGSPSLVEKTVKECIDAAASGGGYILSAVDQPSPDTPVENMRAFVCAGRRYGKCS